jgi:hypothetical protein
MQLLRQSAAWTFQLGPFVDSTDGVTPEASLTIAATDVDVSKNGAAYANKNDATAMTGTGDSQGWYDCVLDATDTGTLGKLDVRCYVSGALPVWREFMVIPANAYDALVAGTGVGVRADVQGWAGTVATAGAIPAVVAGAAGGVFIAGTNAATTITTALTANITGNITGDLSGTVGTLTTYTGNTPQTGDTYALANGATGFVAIDTVVDAVKVVTDALPEGGAFTTIAADTARLTAARAAVLTDWIDGGRLDLLLDTIPTTAMRGTDNAAPAATALTNATWTGAKAAFLDAAISGVGGAVGSGADAVTLELLEDDGVTPIADADVWVSTDAAGANVVAGTLQTNSLGKATFMLDDTVTYYRWAQKDGVNFTNPTSFVASAD